METRASYCCFPDRVFSGIELRTAILVVGWLAWPERVEESSSVIEARNQFERQKKRKDEEGLGSGF